MDRWVPVPEFLIPYAGGRTQTALLMSSPGAADAASLRPHSEDHWSMAGGHKLRAVKLGGKKKKIVSNDNQIAFHPLPHRNEISVYVILANKCQLPPTHSLG